MCIRQAIIAFRRWWLVRIPKPTQIRRHDREMRRQQGKQLMPIERILRGTVQENYCRPAACGDGVHPNAIDAETMVGDGGSGVVVCLYHYDFMCGVCGGKQVRYIAVVVVVLHLRLLMSVMVWRFPAGLKVVVDSTIASPSDVFSTPVPGESFSRGGRPLEQRRTFF